MYHFKPVNYAPNIEDFDMYYVCVGAVYMYVC